MRNAPGSIAAMIIISMVVGLAPGGRSSVEAQERESWILTVDERIQNRLDAQNIQRLLADAETRSGGHAVSHRAGRFVIDGKKNPELFLPWELMDSLLVRVAADEEVARATYRPGIALCGWDYDAFWQDLASRGSTYSSAVEQSIALQRRAISEGLPRTGQDLAAVNLLICRARADVLAGSRARYGTKQFDKFLYVAVAPTLGVASERPMDAATLRWIEGGCR